MDALKIALSSAMLCACLSDCAAFAQTYPTRSVRLIVAGPPGSATDVRARWFAERLSRALGQTVIVDNRAGAGGTVGTETAAKSAPDGYTLVLVHQGTLALAPHMYGRLGYDPIADLSPVKLLTVNPLLLAV